MDEFEKAIIINFDPSVSEDLKSQANAYTEQIKQTPDAWKFCLERLGKTNSVHVKFFCFHVFQDVILYKYATLSEQDRLTLRAGLLNWFQTHLVIQNEEAAIKNKYAQVIVLLFKLEYPEHWTGFFDEFLGAMSKGPLAVDIFLRVLKAIEDEVASFDVHRSAAELAQNTMIKDTLRDREIVRIVKSWYDILVHHNNTSQYPNLANMTIQNIKHYVGWIDINLIVNEQFIPLLCKFLSSRVLREEVCDCFKEIINKGMDPVAKIALIKKLQITKFINFTQLDETDFIVKFGNLINLTGMEILNAKGVENLQQDDEQLLGDVLNLLFQFFNNESDEVSKSVFGFASSYIDKLKRSKQPITEKQLQHITTMVQICRNKMKFLKSYYNEKDEEDNAFLQFRKDLSNIFRNIFRICPDLVGSFIQQSLTNIISTLPPPPESEHTAEHQNGGGSGGPLKSANSSPNSKDSSNLNNKLSTQQTNSTKNTENGGSNKKSTNFSDIEVSIYLLFQMGEGVQSTPEETMKQFEKFFAQMVVLLASSSIAFTEHQVVSLIYFETINRYAKFVLNSPEFSIYLGQILASFLDKRGIHNRDPVVRKHAGYNLNRLVKTMRNSLFQYINVIIEAVKTHLIISFDIQKEVPFEEQLNFYEMLGTLVGYANLPPEQEQLYIDAILMNSIVRLEEITNKALYKTDTKENPFYTTTLYQLIMVIGTFSKGFAALTFSGQPKANIQFKAYFVRALHAIMRIPGALPVMNDEIKAKTLFYLHRMVECLGKDLIPFLTQIIGFLLVHSSKTDLFMEIISFINQSAAKFKEDMTPVLNDTLQTILQRVFKLLNPATPPPPNSDEEREANDLKKSYYNFIYSSLTNGMSGAFVSQTNLGGVFEQVLNTLTEGCYSHNENVQKCSFQSIKKMLEDYVTGGSHPVLGFNGFVYDRILPVFFQVLLSDQFGEFATNPIIIEVSKSLRTLHLKIGTEFDTYIAQRLLPNLKATPEQSLQLLKLLSAQPKEFREKEFNDFFKNFIKSKKLLNNTNGTTINGNH